jgi:hypothetical protein
MTTESAARILGAIVGLTALVMAVVYGPIGQAGKSQTQIQKVEKPAQPVIAPPAAGTPAVRGPVVREVPQ